MVILVTGAGTVGRELLGRPAGHRRVRVMARDPARPAGRGGAGATVQAVAGDY
ncbi:hypothetical protein ACFV29_30940 [Streptomyces sp. NPDC059690]|uniref:hypothetical protein n=1 Tax=Streptomyces sp. NPDC059690 TaxID=3346907 RepID=UPI003673D490